LPGGEGDGSCGTSNVWCGVVIWKLDMLETGSR
jgi:hypothetical protein